MKKTIKHICYAIAIGFVAFLLLGVSFSFLFSEKIEDAVIQHLTNQTENKIEVKNVEFKIFENFPYSSVKISNIYIKESEKFGGDTLLYAKKAHVKFSIVKFLLNEITIDNITIFDGKISLKIDENNNKNFNVLVESDKKNNSLELNKIELIKTDFEFKSSKIQSKISLNCSKISIRIKNEKSLNLQINGKAYSQEITIYEKNYIENKNLTLNLNYSLIDEKNILKSSILQIENVDFLLDGSFDRKNIIKLDFTGKNHNISSLMQHTPNHLKGVYTSIIADGSIDYKGKISGEIGKKKNPNLDINYTIKNGSFETKKYPFYLDNISCNGAIKNGQENNFQTSQITFENFYANTKKGNLEGDFELLNLNNYFLNAEFNSVWDMNEVNYYFMNSPFIDCKGIINAKTKYNGRISFDDDFNIHFLNSEHQSDVELTELSFFYNNYPLKIKVNNSKCKIFNDTINVINSKINILDSDLIFEGKIHSLFNNILVDSTKIIHIIGDLTSTTFNLKSLISNNDKENDVAQEYYMPSILNLDLKTSINSLSYNNIYPSQLTCNLIYKDKAVSTKDLSMNLLGGKMLFDGKFYKNSENKFKLTGNIKLENIDVKRTFGAFNNFGQDFIMAKHIKGISSSSIICNISLNKFLEIDLDKIDIDSKVSIEKGELINFKPLESLSNYVKLDDLAHIKFSKLENEIKIKDKIISIPNMEIKSSVLSLIISGKHFFNQEYNYKISLLLSDLLAKRFRKKDNDFNTQDSTNLLKTNLQLRMIGDKENSDISFEKLKIKENLKNEIKKEILDVKKIISEEINKKEGVEDDDELEIEWDDNF
ncbi:AsmA-like C-terminal region-containing protein [Flavobacteriales bacterium]|nr:AsmA-like C-terminal region-containing protein [Flavobacteriales bacterium]